MLGMAFHGRGSGGRSASRPVALLALIRGNSGRRQHGAARRPLPRPNSYPAPRTAGDAMTLHPRSTGQVSRKHRPGFVIVGVAWGVGISPVFPGSSTGVLRLGPRGRVVGVRPVGVGRWRR